MIGTLMIVELLKLRGSLAALLVVAAPGMMGVLSLAAPLTADRALAWSELVSITLGLWLFFMAPMATTAFATLIAQIEYRPKAWDHVLGLPVRRWRIYAAKAVLAISASAAMTVLAFAFIWAGGTLGSVLAPQTAMTGTFPWGHAVDAGASSFAASLLLNGVLLWTALRFSSFVVPIAMGMGAALVGLAVMVTRTDKADFFPSLLPLNAVYKSNPLPFLLAGSLGGAVVLGLMVLDLSRRELR